MYIATFSAPSLYRIDMDVVLALARWALFRSLFCLPLAMRWYYYRYSYLPCAFDLCVVRGVANEALSDR